MYLTTPKYLNVNDWQTYTHFHIDSGIIKTEPNDNFVA